MAPGGSRRWPRGLMVARWIAATAQRVLRGWPHAVNSIAGLMPSTHAGMGGTMSGLHSRAERAPKRWKAA